MKHLYVWVLGAGGDVKLAGELATSDPAVGGRFEAEFEYAREWTSDPTAFALDPVSLPLLPAGRRFRSEQFEPPLGVFDDALPDDWGRQLLARAFQLDGRSPSPPEMLLALRGGGTGALLFTDGPIPIDAATSVASRELGALLSAAAKFEAGTLPLDDEFRRLLEGSSRVGGARPKALVHDETGEWIAKFPSRTRDGIHDVVGLEATCLHLARRASLSVPESRLHTVARRRVLLVRRFDVTPTGGRIHMVSMRTLYKETRGVFATGYAQLARILEKYSSAPASDVAMLYRHMVFNAAIGNVDDHLKNFWMLALPFGYRLAPAFDLVPDVSQRIEHTLAFQYGFGCPTRRILIEIAKEWAVPEPAETIDRVVDAVAKFPTAARELGVRPGTGLRAVTTHIHRRLALISG